MEIKIRDQNKNLGPPKLKKKSRNPLNEGYKLLVLV
jgi:hypothetical protein